MHLFTRASAILAFALAASVQAVDPDPDFDAITKPGLNEEVAAGTSYTVEWTVPDTAASGPVTISLLGGKDGGSLVPISDIGKAENSDSKFEWEVDASLGDDATYGLQITLDADKTKFQYSTPFRITGGGSSDTEGNGTSTAGPSASATGSKSGSGSAKTTGSATGTGSASETGLTTTTSTKSSKPTESAQPTSSTTAPATVPTNAGAAGAAGAVGLVGGLVLAALAL